MIDAHLRLLREIARRTGRALEEERSDKHVADAMTRDRRKRLERVARRAARQVSNAEARRFKHLKAQRP